MQKSNTQQIKLSINKWANETDSFFKKKKKPQAIFKYTTSLDIRKMQNNPTLI